MILADGAPLDADCARDIGAAISSMKTGKSQTQLLAGPT
jgi:hypothetical protein